MQVELRLNEGQVISGSIIDKQKKQNLDPYNEEVGVDFYVALLALQHNVISDDGFTKIIEIADEELNSGDGIGYIN